MVRCSPTEFTEYTEFVSVCIAGMPYPPTSVRIRAHLWEALLCQKFLCVPCVLWESLSSHGFHRFTQILMVRCSPTEFTEYTEFVSVCIAGMPYPPTSVRIRAHLWEALLCQKFLCVPCVLWESLSSHGFHRFTQMLRVRFVPTEFTESTEFVSVGMAGMPYPPTSVNIRAVCGRLFSARGSVSSVLICGRLFSARSFCAFRAFCGNIFSPMEFTESTEFVSVGIAGMPYPPNLCASVPSVGVLSLQEVLCIRCIPWELLHRLFGWCSRDCCTPWRNPRK